MRRLSPLIFFLALISCPISGFAQNIPEDAPCYKIVEIMPTFPGCEGLERNEARECSKEKLAKLLSPSIKKLDNDSISNIEILLQFTVEADGTIKEAKLLKGDEKYEQAILKAMETTPKWVPGKQRNVPARVLLRMPLKINLE